MVWLLWLRENWFTGLQTLAIVSGFIFTCITLRRDERSRRVGNLFQLNSNHRQLWEQLFTQPQLRGILSAERDISSEPVTNDEALFVGFLILHLNTAHKAIRNQLLDTPEGLAADVRTFFALPIPRAVWEERRRYQDAEFVSFVERHFEANNSR